MQHRRLVLKKTCIHHQKNVQYVNDVTCIATVKQTVLGYQVKVQEMTLKKSKYQTIRAAIEYPPMYNGYFYIQMDAMQGGLMGNDMKL